MKRLKVEFLDSIQEDTIRAAFYIQVFRKAIHEGELTEALHYDSLRLRLFPSYGNGVLLSTTSGS